MRFTLMAVVLTFAGCVGSSGPRTVMGGVATLDSAPKEVRRQQPLWWQRTTVGVSKEDNPWEKFNQPKVLHDDDPWADFQEPVLFTPEFKERLQKEERIKKALRKALRKLMHPKEM